MNREKSARKIVSKLIPNFWFYVGFSFVLSLIIQLIGLIPPIIMRNIIDDYIPNKDLAETFKSIIWFSIIPFCMTIISTFYNYRLTISGRNIGQKISLLGTEKIINQPISYFDNKNSSEIATYCRAESMKYVVFWLFDIPQLIANIIVGICLFVLVAEINIYIALGIILYIPFLLIPSNIFAKKAKSYVKSIIENNGKTSQIVADTFRGIRFVKTMAIEKIQLNKLKSINDHTVSIWSQTSALENLNNSWMNSLSDSLFLGLIFAVGALFIIQGNMTIGMLIILLNYCPKFFSVVKVASKTNFDFKKQLGEYDKLFEILVMNEEKDLFNGRKEFNFNKNIKFKNVRFKYSEDREQILNDLTFELEKGQWIGIVGSSGAGKTTIFDLLLMLYKANDGDILVDDESIYNIDIKQIRSNITKVAQETFLFPGTFKENLILGNINATDNDIYQVLEMVGLGDFIRNLSKGLDTDIGESGVQLSGGEQQRLALAQGLLRNSKILLLDEVTANVDTITEKHIKNVIKKIVKERNITVISIAHRLNFLEYTDKIIVIKDGVVVDEGKYDEIKNRNQLFMEANV